MDFANWIESPVLPAGMQTTVGFLAATEPDSLDFAFDPIATFAGPDELFRVERIAEWLGQPVWMGMLPGIGPMVAFTETTLEVAYPVSGTIPVYNAPRSA